MKHLETLEERKKKEEEIDFFDKNETFRNIGKKEREKEEEIDFLIKMKKF